MILLVLRTAGRIHNALYIYIIKGVWIRQQQAEEISVAEGVWGTEQAATEPVAEEGEAKVVGA